MPTSREASQRLNVEPLPTMHLQQRPKQGAKNRISQHLCRSLHHAMVHKQPHKTSKIITSWLAMKPSTCILMCLTLLLSASVSTISAYTYNDFDTTSLLQQQQQQQGSNFESPSDMGAPSMLNSEQAYQQQNEPMSSIAQSEQSNMQQVDNGKLLSELSSSSIVNKLFASSPSPPGSPDQFQSTTGSDMSTSSTNNDMQQQPQVNSNARNSFDSLAQASPSGGNSGDDEMSNIMDTSPTSSNDVSSSITQQQQQDQQQQQQQQQQANEVASDTSTAAHSNNNNNNNNDNSNGLTSSTPSMASSALSSLTQILTSRRGASQATSGPTTSNGGGGSSSGSSKPTAQFLKPNSNNDRARSTTTPKLSPKSKISSPAKLASEEAIIRLHYHGSGGAAGASHSSAQTGHSQGVASLSSKRDDKVTKMSHQQQQQHNSDMDQSKDGASSSASLSSLMSGKGIVKAMTDNRLARTMTSIGKSLAGNKYVTGAATASAVAALGYTALTKLIFPYLSLKMMGSGAGMMPGVYPSLATDRESPTGSLISSLNSQSPFMTIGTGGSGSNVDFYTGSLNNNNNNNNLDLMTSSTMQVPQTQATLTPLSGTYGNYAPYYQQVADPASRNTYQQQQQQQRPQSDYATYQQTGTYGYNNNNNNNDARLARFNTDNFQYFYTPDSSQVNNYPSIQQQRQQQQQQQYQQQSVQQSNGNSGADQMQSSSSNLQGTYSTYASPESAMMQQGPNLQGTYSYPSYTTTYTRQPEGYSIYTLAPATSVQPSYQSQLYQQTRPKQQFSKAQESEKAVQNTAAASTTATAAAAAGGRPQYQSTGSAGVLPTPKRSGNLLQLKMDDEDTRKILREHLQRQYNLARKTTSTTTYLSQPKQYNSIDYADASVAISDATPVPAQQQQLVGGITNKSAVAQATNQQQQHQRSAPRQQQFNKNDYYQFDSSPLLQQQQQSNSGGGSSSNGVTATPIDFDASANSDATKVTQQQRPNVDYNSSSSNNDKQRQFSLSDNLTNNNDGSSTSGFSPMRQYKPTSSAQQQQQQQQQYGSSKQLAPNQHSSGDDATRQRQQQATAVNKQSVVNTPDTNKQPVVDVNNVPGADTFSTLDNTSNNDNDNNDKSID